MLQTEVRAATSPIEMRINVAAPASFFAKDFAAVSPDSVFIHPACAELDARSYGPNDRVLIARLDHGRISFQTARWGHGKQDVPVEYYRQCIGQSLGYPALIPATSIDLIGDERAVRLAHPEGGNLYVGCMYFQVSPGALISVVPLIREAGPDISPHSDFQLLLMPIRALPRPGILDFISPHGAPHLRGPSPAGSVHVELLGVAR